MFKSNAPYVRKRLDPEKVFKNYRLESFDENRTKYLVRFTSILFTESGNEDYTCELGMSFKYADELEEYTYKIADVLTSGRKELQMLAKNFRITKEYENNVVFADISSLIGKYGVAYLTSSGEVDSIVPAQIVSEEDIQTQQFLEENSSIMEEIQIPEVMDRYVMIPITDDFKTNTTYHAVLNGFKCYKSNVEGDADVKFKVRVINGTLKMSFPKYFKEIRTLGKSNFSRFCIDFEMLSEFEKLDWTLLKSKRLCKVTLSQNNDGYFVVDAISPLDYEDELIFTQYEKLLEEVFEKMQALADAGDSFAANEFARMCINKEFLGLGNYDYPTAIEYLKKSPLVTGYYGLAKRYQNGQGVEKSLSTALEYYKKSAEYGYNPAEYHLSDYFSDNGWGIKDANKNFYWLNKAYYHGNIKSIGELAWCYEKGIGVVQNWEKAVELYQESAEQGDAIAQYRLGDCYYYGHGVEKNYIKAFEWFQKSAEYEAYAQYCLGWCYEKGEGTSCDIELAKKYYRMAADKGENNAKKQCERLGC